MRLLKVLRPGLLTTVQDLGRARQAEGVPAGGAMDRFALRLANLAVGNAEGAAALEVTLLGPTLEVQGDVVLAIAGADLGARLDDRPVPLGRAVRTKPGAWLTFGGSSEGCRAYVAVAGGIDVPLVLGSRSTYLRGRFGGLAGRALAAGDVLPLGGPTPLNERIAKGLAPGRATSWTAVPANRPDYRTDVLRALPGAHLGLLTPEARETLWRAPFRVTSESDRMGFRLEGPPLELEHATELVSEPVAFGTVQLPPAGRPILLMADRQSAGGYPRILEVAGVDLPVAAQARPGATLRFQEISLHEAQHLYIARERSLARLSLAIALQRG